MILLTVHPGVAVRSCEHCLAFIYNEADGKPALHAGGLVPRGKGPPAPCRTTLGCPRGTPENDLGLNARNLRALEFHRRCEAVGRFPDDPLVAANAVTIRSAEDEADRIIRERENARRQRTPHRGDP